MFFLFNNSAKLVIVLLLVFFQLTPLYRAWRDKKFSIWSLKFLKKNINNIFYNMAPGKLLIMVEDIYDSANYQS